MVFRLKRNNAMANERTPMRAPWGDIAPRLTEISDNGSRAVVLSH
jgi:hypothetical protein